MPPRNATKSCRAEEAREEAQLIAEAKEAMEMRNDAIFTKLEEALTVSVEPLDKMFREAGMSPDDLIEIGPRWLFRPGRAADADLVSTSGTVPSARKLRANAILAGLDRMNMYRMAAFKLPFAMPVRDGRPLDLRALATATTPSRVQARGCTRAPIWPGPTARRSYATADGVVIHAGWENGYGRLSRSSMTSASKPAMAIFAQIRVEVGQRVSRGDRIGDMGNSGRSTGTHLHYEVRLGGNPSTR
jgi:hypothetical protein